MDPIREALDRIQELSADELSELEGSVLSEFDEIEKQDTTRDTVARMNELADAADALKGEKERREVEATELSAARDAATARVKGVDDTNADDTAKKGADDQPEDDEEDDDDPGKPDVVDAKKSVASTEQNSDAAAASKPDQASVEFEPDSDVQVEQPNVQPEELDENPEVGKPDSEIPQQESVNPVDERSTDTLKDGENPPADKNSEAAVVKDSTNGKDPEAAMTAAADGTVEVPDDRRPKAATTTVAITAGADIPGLNAGTKLPNLRSVADALLSRKQAMGRTSGGDGEQHTVATFHTEFPEDRQLSSGSRGNENASKVDAVVSPQAVTAAGGLCAPVEVSYDIYGLGELGRPVRDALAVFSADRGGIRFVTPPLLADLAGAVSTWTLQDDIDAATPGAPDPVKPCIRVNCGSEVTVYTDAIPLCLTFGNLGARAWPELVERHTELGMIWHARYAEQRLLTRIGSLSTSVSAARVLGAARDFFVQLERAAAAYRNRHRMSNVAPLRVILPQWFQNMLRADLTMQLPGDSQDETFNLADNFMNGWFNVRHINVTWHMDGESGQIFGAQSAGTLLDFPANVIWYLFSEGTFIFLDGGTLDLGLVRDSTLNGTNDYKIFLETFEGVAKVGVEALRVTSPLKVTGASAGTVSTNS